MIIILYIGIFLVGSISAAILIFWYIGGFKMVASHESLIRTLIAQGDTDQEIAKKTDMKEKDIKLYRDVHSKRQPT